MEDISVTYGDFSIGSLKATVKNPAHVRSLDLSVNEISPDMMVTIVNDFISHMVSLEELDLKGNKIGPLGTKSLCNGIRRHCRKMRYLDLSENGILNESLLHVAHLLQDTRIRSLCLVSNHLTRRGIATLCDGVVSTNYIQHLTLAFNAVSEEGASILAKELGNHPSLQSLDLSDNEIGDIGAVAIATHIIMSRNSCLEVLNLSVNRIGDVGFAAIGEALANTKNRSLKNIDLACNDGVGVAGREAFIKNVGLMKHLRCLDLCTSNLSDENARELVSAVSRKTCGIIKIEWYNNPEMQLESEKALFMTLKRKEDALLVNENRWRQLKYFVWTALFIAMASSVALVPRRMRR